MFLRTTDRQPSIYESKCLPENGFTSEGETEVVHQLQGFLGALIQVVEEWRELGGGVVLASGAGYFFHPTIDVRDGALGGLQIKKFKINI